MDPDALLARMREILQQAASGKRVELAEAVELMELVEALDGWLVRGGALPAAWSKRR